MKSALVYSTLFCGVMLMNGSLSGVSATDIVRPPAVAGTFYDDNPTLLRNMLLRYLADGKPLGETVRMLISPHAGYVFSGAVAAKGYATIDNNIRRVIIIGPSHYKAFAGIAVPKFDAYSTPLGSVRVDRPMVEALLRQPGVVAADGFDEPEHSLEVQLPFLQVQLKDFSCIPMLTGKTDPEKVAAMLVPFIDASTIVVASSDLSHYQPQQSARAIDDTTIATILSGAVAGPIDACGEVPIRILMHLAKKLKLRPVKIDARTSYETAPRQCPESRVVGYLSVAYVADGKAGRDGARHASAPVAAPAGLSAEMEKMLLHIARGSLEASVTGKKFSEPGDLPALLKEPRGCFVTLTAGGRLRGCIGYIEPIKSLYQAVIENAASAALHDPRFPQVRPEELKNIKVEVSVLTKPEPLSYTGPDDLLKKLVQGRDGVILRKGNRQSTYLPQVWEQLPDKEAFLEQLSLKAGMPPDGWKDADVQTYRAVHFEE